MGVVLGLAGWSGQDDQGRHENVERSHRLGLADNNCPYDATSPQVESQVVVALPQKIGELARRPGLSVKTIRSEGG
jgi:hypothetical protein